MGIYAPEVKDYETGEINFPPIKQDNTEVYVHNLLQALDEMNTVKINKPLQILLIGKNEPTELELEQIDSLRYTHDLIKNVATDPTYIIHSDIATTRTDTTYGDTTLFHLTDQKTGKYLYEQNLQISYNLSAFYHENLTEEPDEIEYGVGELDEYTRPCNISATSLHYKLKDHEIEEDAHNEINPKFLVRQIGEKYKANDIVWPSVKSNPNYIMLEAIQTGTAELSVENLKPMLEYNLLNSYEVPKNVAAQALHKLFIEHAEDKHAHEEKEPLYLFRQKDTYYDKDDTVFIDIKQKYTFLYLQALNSAYTSNQDKVDLGD